MCPQDYGDENTEEDLENVHPMNIRGIPTDFAAAKNEAHLPNNDFRPSIQPYVIGEISRARAPRLASLITDFDHENAYTQQWKTVSPGDVGEGYSPIFGAPPLTDDGSLTPSSCFSAAMPSQASENSQYPLSVSYTHLTLPTIYSV